MTVGFSVELKIRNKSCKNPIFNLSKIEKKNN